MSAFCKKHPTVELEIKQGKKNQNFVACRECRPDLFGEPKPKTTPEPTPTPEQKKNVKWYDRVLF